MYLGNFLWAGVKLREIVRGANTGVISRHFGRGALGAMSFSWCGLFAINRSLHSLKFYIRPPPLKTRHGGHGLEFVAYQL